VEGKTKTLLLLAEMFVPLFLIGLLTNLPPGDVTRQAKTPSHLNRLKFQAHFQTALTLKGHYHFHSIIPTS
jgi:hypothetical protein